GFRVLVAGLIGLGASGGGLAERMTRRLHRLASAWEGPTEHGPPTATDITGSATGGTHPPPYGTGRIVSRELQGSGSRSALPSGSRPTMRHYALYFSMSTRAVSGRITPGSGNSPFLNFSRSSVPLMFTGFQPFRACSSTSPTRPSSA